MMLQKKGSLSLRVSQLVVLLSALLCGVAQLLFFEDHLLYVIESLLGTAMVFYALRSRMLCVSPISCMILIGYGCSWFYLPLVTTTYEWKPLINNLDRPDLVFFHNLILFVALIGAHILYLKIGAFQAIRQAITNKLLRPLEFFRAPSSTQLWSMGFISFVCTIYISAGAYNTTEGSANILSKIMVGFVPYTYTPYLLLIYPMMDKSLSVKKGVSIPQLILYSVLVCGAGLALSSRTTILVGFASVGLSLLLGSWLGILNPKKNSIWKILLVVVVGYLILSPLTILAKAIVVARDERDKVSTLDLVKKTIEAYTNPKTSSEYEKRMEQVANGNEQYLDNLYMSRICNLRYADNTLQMVSKFNSNENAEITHVEMQKILCFLPQPVLSMLSIDIDKNYIISGSGGDFIYKISGCANPLGEMKTGSLISIIYCIFGMFYPLWMGLTAIGIYILVDSYVLHQTDTNIITPQKYYFSAVVLASMFPITFIFTSAALGCETYSSVIGFIIRGYIQMIIFYIAIYWISRLISLRKLSIDIK